MTNLSLFYTGMSLLTVGLTAGSIIPLLQPVSAQVNQPTNTVFPDTENYWAQPYIARLAERNIVTGYPDGTYRPRQTLERDEFAAIVMQTFTQPTERQIPSGSVYDDVPQGYWAEEAIQQAYQMGFMKGYPGNVFRPRQEVSKVEAIVSLAQNLNLATPLPSPSARVLQPVAPSTPASRAKRRPMKPLLFPLASTTLLQPFVSALASTIPPAVATPAPVTPPAGTPKTITVIDPPLSSAAVVNQYYEDANQIPPYAIDEVANATLAGVVPNYPNLRMLNPTAPISRGETAALIYRVLVNQGRVEPLPGNTSATEYIVEPR